MGTMIYTGLGLHSKLENVIFFILKKFNLNFFLNFCKKNKIFKDLLNFY